MPYKIVLIEPTEPDQRWMEMALTETGIRYQIEIFPSAIAALDALGRPETAERDAVIINALLPMLELSEAVPQLRALPALASAPFAVTIVDETIDLPVVPSDCIPLRKPVTSEDICRVLKRARAAAAGDQNEQAN